MIRSIPYRRNKNIKMGSLGIDVEPRMPEETGTPGSDPMPEEIFTEADSQNILNQYSDFQNQEGGASQDQLNQTAREFISKFVNAFLDITSSEDDYVTPVDTLNATSKYMSQNLEIDASPADKVSTANKAQLMQDNVLREAAQTNNTQVNNGINVYVRSNFYVLRADAEVCEDVVNEARDQNESDVQEDAENKINDKQSKGKITDTVAKTLVKILAWLATIGSVILIDWLIAKYKTDCYFINGASENKLGCPDYSEQTSACQCPALSAGTGSNDQTVVDASEQGAGEYPGLPDACKDAETADIKNCPVCAKAGAQTLYCKGPENIPSLDTPVCPTDGKSYFVWKQYSWLDILGGQLNAANDAANDLFNGLNWTFENIGKVIIGIAVLIGAIILIKILQLLLQFGKKK